MTQPVDPTELLGDAWCVVLTRTGVPVALEILGVPPEEQRATDLDEATRLVEEGDGEADSVLMLARPVVDGWTLVVEIDGSTGMPGNDPELVRRLADAGTACSAMQLADTEQVVHSTAGEPAAVFNSTTSFLLGDGSEAVRTALSVAGFDLSEAHEDRTDVRELDPGSRAVLALSVLTGVELREEHFDGPWTGGLTA